jgi:hypothetical protein
MPADYAHAGSAVSAIGHPLTAPRIVSLARTELQTQRDLPPRSLPPPRWAAVDTYARSKAVAAGAQLLGV